MPRRQIQRAFLSWLDANQDRFAVTIRLGKRTDGAWEFSFVRVNSAIRGVLTTHEINVDVEYVDQCWDLLLSLDASPRRATRGGYYCACCPPEARRTFPDRQSLWTDHLFEPLLEWVNESLAKAKWLALSGDPGYATQARLLPGDDPSEALPGGGCMLSFAFVSGEVELRNRKRRPPILVPCRFD
jgi:hypothetical protein